MWNLKHTKVANKKRKYFFHYSSLIFSNLEVHKYKNGNQLIIYIVFAQKTNKQTNKQTKKPYPSRKRNSIKTYLTK